MLTDLDRGGTVEQRRFVEKALNTPNFMLLEGPPGSGKTTAICELILQMAEQGKRVLLCASTHMAVYNVLEKPMDVRNRHRDEIIPVRIGEKRSVSEKARKWQLVPQIRLAVLNPRGFRSCFFMSTSSQVELDGDSDQITFLNGVTERATTNGSAVSPGSSFLTGT